MNAVRKLREDLKKAEEALYHSEKALKTHGNQGLTWFFYKTDAERVRELKKHLAYLRKKK